MKWKVSYDLGLKPRSKPNERKRTNANERTRVVLERRLSRYADKADEREGEEEAKGQLCGGFGVGFGGVKGIIFRGRLR